MHLPHTALTAYPPTTLPLPSPKRFKALTTRIWRHYEHPHFTRTSVPKHTQRSNHHPHRRLRYIRYCQVLNHRRTLTTHTILHIREIHTFRSIIMQVGELYNTDRYGLLIVLSIEPIYKTPAYGQVYRVKVMRLDGTNRTQYGEFSQSDWDRMHTRLV